MEVGNDVAVVAVTAGGDSLEVGVGDGLVVVPHPAAHVVPEDVRHVVTRGGRGAVVTDDALQLVAVLLRPSVSSSWLALHAGVGGAGEDVVVVVVLVDCRSA